VGELGGHDGPQPRADADAHAGLERLVSRFGWRLLGWFRWRLVGWLGQRLVGWLG
jgi:hypothetical protein